MSCQEISVAIPTFGRTEVLLDSVRHVLALRPAPLELLVVDQTPQQAPEVANTLASLAHEGVRWIRLSRPSVPAAMNRALLEARAEVLLFLDDDVEPSADLFRAHLEAHATGSADLVAGQVLQPWEPAPRPLAAGEAFRFSATDRQEVQEFIGCNFSVRRQKALAIGGFDERFTGAAYRYERDFSDRLRESGGHIAFEPRASVRHLKASSGGVRQHGDHLHSIRPSHSSGEYYYLLRHRRPGTFRQALRRLVGSICTSHHLRQPWWIPATLAAEMSGLAVAAWHASQPPRYIASERTIS